MCPLKMSSSSTPQSLNSIRLAGTVWLASDIHLSPHTPATTAAFLDFLDRAAQHADALLLPGDIFDAWIGDDFALDDPPAWLSTVLDALLDTSRQLRLFLGRGNRDFLMGHGLAKRIGAELLPDRVCLETDFGHILLSHGDEYCTADAAYQRFRRIVRKPGIQRLFLALGLGLRRAIADWARNRSRNNNQYKSATIMDVHPDAIHDAFRESGCDTIVHGHTHRPAIHDLQLDGRACRRIVLPDWDYEDSGAPRGGWLAIDRHGPVLHQIS